MEIRPFGLGLGVFIAIIFFLCSFFYTIVIGKVKGFAATIGFNIFIILLLVILFTWPIEQKSNILQTNNDEYSNSQQVEQTDIIFFPRVVLLVFLIYTVVRVISQFCKQLFEPEFVKSVRHRHKCRENKLNSSKL